VSGGHPLNGLHSLNEATQTPSGQTLSVTHLKEKKMVKKKKGTKNYLDIQ
jgi:hypothetical protein